MKWSEGISNVVGVSRAGLHNFALTREGEVKAWGDPGKSDLPGTLNRVTAIDGSDGNHIVLRTDSKLVYWSQTFWQPARLPVGLSNIANAAFDGYSGMLLTREGELIEWGDLFPQISERIVPSREFVSAAVRAGSILALRGNGTVQEFNYLQPVRVPSGLSNVIAIALSDMMRVALRSDGSILTWPAARPEEARQLEAAPGAAPIVDLAVTGDIVFGPGTDGIIQTWGSLKIPEEVTDVVAIHAGYGTGPLAIIGEGAPFFRPAVDLRTAVAGETHFIYSFPFGARPVAFEWRLNGVGLPGETNALLKITELQLSDSGTYTLVASNAFGVAEQTFELTVVPVAIEVPLSGAQVTPGISPQFSIGARGSNLAFQWYRNGELLEGETGSSLQLQNVQSKAGGIYSVRIQSSAGAVTNSAELHVSNLAFLGENSRGQREAPNGITDFTMAACGQVHTLALRQNGTVLAWGSSRYGETNVPAGLTNIIAIAAGAHHNLALSADGTVSGWGLNDEGQADVPEDVTNAVRIAAGAQHSLALLRDGSVRAWGTGKLNITRPPDGLTNVTAIAAGAYHSLALLESGRVVVWGSNGSDQSRVPASLTNAVAIAAGSFHSLALKADGSVVLWGGRTTKEVLFVYPATNFVQIAAGGDMSYALTSDGKLFSWDAYDQLVRKTEDRADWVKLIAGYSHAIGLTAPVPVQSAQVDSSPSVQQPVTADSSLLPGNFFSSREIPPINLLPGKVGTITCFDYPQINYQIFLPSNYSATGPPLPILITFNPDGGGMVTQFRNVAADLGIILVGVTQSKNFTFFKDVVDAEYAMCRDLRLRVNYDPTAVFAGGLSGGGWASFDFSKFYRPFVAGVLSMAGWVGWQYGIPDRFRPGFLVARTWGMSDLGAPFQTDIDFFEKQGALFRTWMFQGGHEVPSAAVLRECLTWLVDQRIRATEDDKRLAVEVARQWKNEWESGDRSSMVRQVVRTILTKPCTFEAHYAQLLLDEAERDYAAFRQLNLTGLAEGDDAADFFYFCFYGAGRLAAKYGADRALYLSALQALGEIRNHSGIRDDNVRDIIRTTGLPPQEYAVTRKGDGIRVEFGSAGPLIAMSLSETSEIESIAWTEITDRVVESESGGYAFEMPMDSPHEFFRLNSMITPKIGLPQNSTGPNYVYQ